MNFAMYALSIILALGFISGSPETSSVVGYSVKRGIIFVENGHLRLTDKGREFAGKSVVEEFIV